MPDHIDELAAVIEYAGGTLKLYGKPIAVEALRKHAALSAASRLAATVAGIEHTPGKLPIPRLTATVYPPVSRGSYGAVVVTLGGRKHAPGAAPSGRYDHARKRTMCTLCKVTGHARSNRKFHPRRDG